MFPYIIMTTIPKICVLMWYDDPIRNYADINYEINKVYCTKYGYDLIKSHEKMYKDRHAAWERLPLIFKHIEQYDYVIWIDADAHFYVDSPCISTIINKYPTQHFIFSGDINGKLPGEINTGVVIVKNDPASIPFLNEWAYNADLYKKNPFPKWWDQGVVRYMYKNNMLDIQKNSVTIPYGVLQHFYEHELSKFVLQKPFIHHSAGMKSSVRVESSNKYYTRFLKSL